MPTRIPPMHQHQLEIDEDEEEELGEKFEFDDSDEDSAQAKKSEADGGFYSEVDEGLNNGASQQAVVLSTFQSPVLPAPGDNTVLPPPPGDNTGLPPPGDNSHKVSVNVTPTGLDNQSNSPGRISNDKPIQW